MTNLLCLIGLHRPAWTPHVHDTPWLQLRVCTRCGLPIERHHR